MGTSQDTGAKTTVKDKGDQDTRSNEANLSEKSGAAGSDEFRANMRFNPIFTVEGSKQPQTKPTTKILAKFKSPAKGKSKQVNIEPKSKGSRFSSLEDDIEAVDVDERESNLMRRGGGNLGGKYGSSDAISVGEGQRNPRCLHG